MSEQVPPELEELRRMVQDARNDWTIITARAMNKMAEHAMSLRQTLGDLTWEEAMVEWVRRCTDCALGACTEERPANLTGPIPPQLVRQDPDPDQSKHTLMAAAIRINRNGEVIITYEEPVQFMAMPPDAALLFAKLLTAAAYKALGKPPFPPDVQPPTKES